jgi:hypothetical protein
VAVPDAVLRRKLFQASSQHQPVLQRAQSAGAGWAKISCRCGNWTGIALHEHQMDELVRAVREAFAADQLALSRFEMLVEDHPTDAVPTVSIAEIKSILMGDVIV